MLQLSVAMSEKIDLWAHSPSSKSLLFLTGISWSKDDTAKSEGIDNVCTCVCSLPIHTKIGEQQY